MFSDFLLFLHDLLPSGEAHALPDFYHTGIASLQTLPEFYHSLDPMYAFIFTCFAFMLALASCFFGYKLSKFFMGTSGFLAGLMIGFYTFSEFIDIGFPINLALSLILGALLASVSYKVYKAGVFLLCAVFSFVGVASLLPVGGELQFFLCTLVALIVGIAATKCMRPVIIFTSAIVGGISSPILGANVVDYMNYHGFDTYLEKPYIIPLFILLGIVVQFLTSSNPEEDKAAQKDKKRKEKKMKQKRDKKAKKNRPPKRAHAKKSLGRTFLDAIDRGDDYDIDEDDMRDRNDMDDTYANIYVDGGFDKNLYPNDIHHEQHYASPDAEEADYMDSTFDHSSDFKDMMHDAAQTGVPYGSDFYGIESYNREEQEQAYANNSDQDICDASYTIL